MESIPLSYLIVGLVILGLLTMLALSGMRDSTIQEKMAGASRESGLAFQAADDLLDATATAAEAGKRTAKDAARGKATIVAVHGVGPARTRLAAAVEEAVGGLDP